MTDKTIIEIGGVKMEVDLRYAKRIDNMRVGDRVKVLKKNYSEHSVYPGIIVGFEPFQELPTIVVAYIESSWKSCEIKFMHYNKASKDCELVVAADVDWDHDKSRLLALFDREIAECERKRAEIEGRRKYFESNFKVYWEKVEAV
jgi:hypothetical protein